MGLLVSVDSTGERTTLSFHGELDLSDGPGLDAIIEAVSGTDATDVVMLSSLADVLNVVELNGGDHPVAR